MKFISKLVVVTILFIICNSNSIYATNTIIEETSKTFNLSEIVDKLDEYSNSSKLGSELNLSEISRNLITGKNTNYSKLIQKVMDIFSKEIVLALKSGISVLIIVVIMGIFNSLEIDSNSSINKVVYLASIILIATLLINTYAEVIKSYTQVITIIASIMQTVTPFIMVVMVASGKLVSTSLIQPIILFIASLVGFLINYIVIPFITISIVMNIVSSLSENIRLNKLGSLFSKSSLWITGVIFTLFLSVISIKGSMTTSIDSAVIKTTQTAVSNFIPVVGKFVSDSLESIMGATEVIGKAAGIIGIIVMIVVTLVPIIQVIVVFVSHKVLAALSETITDNKNIIGIIDSFAETYKILLGILIGILALFVMSTGVLIKLIGSI